MTEIKRVRLKPDVRARLVVASEDETFGDLADRAGVSRNWLSKVFNGHSVNCRLVYAVKLAQALGTSVERIATPIDPAFDFGHLLRRLRRYKNVSQVGLADAMGVHVSKLSRIEKGAHRARLTMENIEAAIEKLDLSREDADALVDAWAPLDLDEE